MLGCLESSVGPRPAYPTTPPKQGDPGIVPRICSPWVSVGWGSATSDPGGSSLTLHRAWGQGQRVDVSCDLCVSCVAGWGGAEMHTGLIELLGYLKPFREMVVPCINTGLPPHCDGSSQVFNSLHPIPPPRGNCLCEVPSLPQSPA